MIYNMPIRGGANIGGGASIATPTRMRIGCFCGVTYTETPSGGITCGAVAIEDDGIFYGSGGVVCGGTCLVDLVQDAWDGVEAVWPLFEDGGPYIDRSRHHYDGTAQGEIPIQEDGIYCLNSQGFYSDSWIELPSDSIGTTQSFTISLWVSWHAYFEQSAMFSRGYDDGTDENVYALGRTVVPHALATYHTNDLWSPEYAFGTPLKLDRFYHIGSSWNGTEAKIYVDGVLQGQTSLRNTNLKELTNSCFIGRYNSGAIPDANILFVRLYPEAKSAAWIKAEHDLFCSREFYYVDKRFTPTYG